MASESNLYKFNNIYDDTYSDILEYVIIKCRNVNDANDILQEIYLELWKILNKKELSDINIKSYLIGIAINKIKKHYSVLERVKTISLFQKNDKDLELIDTIEDDFNIDDLIVKNDNWDMLWKYIKSKKNQDIPKIFYLHYKQEFSIKEISKCLRVTESYVKNLIYRALKELHETFGRDV